MNTNSQPDTENDNAPQTVGEAWLRGLSARGVSMFFANAGTDFPSIVEGLARAEALGFDVPRPITAPHENAAVSMAHGYTLVTGHAQAVMVHVNVGTANALGGLINAERDYVPMLFAAGRTPLLEMGDSSSRSLNIHWAQDMFDQGGMVREFMRWDFELRDPRQLEPALDRALTLAHSAPRGPVHMIMPREVLAAAPAETSLMKRRSAPANILAPDPEAIAEAVAALARAQRPLIITARSGADRGVPARLGALATALGAPVVEFRPRHLSLSTRHPLHGGFESQPWFDQADAILVIDCDVPWIPSTGQPRPDAVIIQAGDDPLQARYPTRGFASDITVRGTARLVIDALLAELDGRAAQTAAARGDEMAAACARMRQASHRFSLREPPATMTMAWASYCVDQARAPGSILVNEYPLVRSVMETTEPGTFFGSSPSGGLGWGLPAAIGVKLAAPDTEVIVASGDGSWIFANPVACHQIAAAEGVALLAVIFNNAAWGAVHRATQAVHPDGFAMRANRMPLTALDPSPAYAAIAEACGLWGETVANPAALPAALDRALAIVRGQKRSAVLDVRCVWP